MVVFGGLIYAYIRVFTSWTGRKSRAQQEQSRKTARVRQDIARLLSRKSEVRKQLEPYQETTDSQPKILERPESLIWHERARQLWQLRNRGYRFDGEYDPAHQCWLGEEKHTGALAVLACYPQTPQDLSPLADYARRVASNQGRTEIELIVAAKQNDPAPRGPPEDEDYRLRYTSEAELLADLVDFSNYFDDICDRVERARLMDSSLTLKDTYTPSGYRSEDEAQDRELILEDFIHDWLGNDTEPQLPLLGGYGQGKSTASLMLCYRLIERLDQHPDVRGPILIKLRGKNLRSLTPEELLATWTHHYGIKTQALLHLHRAGRLLLIFEGFDEIDQRGNTETRISHFRSLWGPNYPEAKLVVTGRPNFFLDSTEFRHALGGKEQTRTLYLKPFDLDRIAHSLRALDPATRWPASPPTWQPKTYPTRRTPVARGGGPVGHWDPRCGVTECGCGGERRFPCAARNVSGSLAFGVGSAVFLVA